MTYELINSETANTLACFASREEAEEAQAELVRSDDRFSNIVIVAFDDEGLAHTDGDDDAPRARAEAVEAFSAPRVPSAN